MLPVINVPSANLVLPVSGKKIRVKSYTLKEDKNFIAMSDVGGNSDKDVFFLVSELLKNVISEGDPDILNYNSTDVIAIFIKVCEISKGKNLELKYKCRNTVNNGKCKGTMPVTVDISDYEIIGKPITKPVPICGDISFMMHYPTLKDLKDGFNIETDTEGEKYMRMIANIIDKVYQGTELFDEFSRDELQEWMKDLPLSSLNGISDFINSMPQVKKTISTKCPDCGKEYSWDIGALEDFFGLDILENLT